MEQTISGHELNTLHDMKKLTIVITQAILDQLQEGIEKGRKIQIYTSNTLLVADRIETKEPEKESSSLLYNALLES
ncbi:hypothetical protein LC087_15895 [Bacillus carboniphilus]|uniref:Uncharacterized protein n=1 Tax=Bacillus carboniphilus TaxID=86663 RepID=A0ABY9JS19_9BACI|nr:hypothetical protein [Bacillus carboniphilus]WLR42204.1 hypothetical protein LC087_15895 [Bacillus carboniphilus]